MEFSRRVFFLRSFHVDVLAFSSLCRFLLCCVLLVLALLQEAVSGDGGKREREINPCVSMVLSDKDMRSGTAVRDDKTFRSADGKYIHGTCPADGAKFDMVVDRTGGLEE